MATTSSAWPERCSAWTPQPVPRSSARATGSRTVSWASDVDAGLTPEHVVGRDADQLAVEPGGQVADDPPVAVVVGVGAAVEQRAHLAAGRDEHAALDERVDEAGEGAVRVGPVDLGLEEEQPDQGLQR